MQHDMLNSAHSHAARPETSVSLQTGVRTLAVFRALQLGDMLCAAPALRALRAHFPLARITLIGLPWAEQFAVRFQHYIDDFVAFPGHPDLPEQPVQPENLSAFYDDMRARNFDLALQLHGSGTTSNAIVRALHAKATAGHTPRMENATSISPPLSSLVSHYLAYDDTGAEPLRLLRLVELLGAPALGDHLEFPITTEDQEALQVSGVCRELAPGSYVCIHAGARSRDKCWPAHCFAEVADRVADESGLRVVLTGSAQEAGLAQAVADCMRNKTINAATSLSIGAMALLMRRSRLLVCNDTGVSHIAAGLRLPSVVVFSKSDMARWAPLEQSLHCCVWDPDGTKAKFVAGAALALLKKEVWNSTISPD